MEPGRGDHAKGNYTCHVIPVMLAAKNGTPTFGPMSEKWSPEDVEKVCHNVSFILINSRNYTNAVGHKTPAYGCIPKKTNFSDLGHFAGADVTRASVGGTPNTVYLSIVQDFGPRQAKEPYVNIRPRGIDKNLRHSLNIRPPFDISTDRCHIERARSEHV